MNTSSIPQVKPKNQQGAGPKGARHTLASDRLSLDLCYTCPLHDCVGEHSLACPINQARRAARAARQAKQEVVYVSR